MPSLSRIGLGGVTFGREIDRDASFRILDSALEKGIRVIDTAEAYGHGASEMVIGEWLRSRRAAGLVSVHTKVSFAFTPEKIRQAVARSLERLGLDRVEIYYVHKRPQDSPLAEAIAALSDIRREGLIGGIGCSNFTASELREALQLAPIGAFQPIFNLAVPDARQELFPLCRSHGVRVITYSPLGAGFLTGKYGQRGEQSVAGSRFDVVPGHRAIYFKPNCFDRLEVLARVARETGIPQHLLALAWVLRSPEVETMLVGARETRHIDNAVAAEKLELADDVWEILDKGTR